MFVIGYHHHLGSLLVTRRDLTLLLAVPLVNSRMSLVIKNKGLTRGLSLDLRFL